MKVSSLTARERRLAERVGNGQIHDDSDAMVLGVGFVVERRRHPTVPLVRFLKSADVDQLREGLEFDVEAPKKRAAKKTTAPRSRK